MTTPFNSTSFSSNPSDSFANDVQIKLPDEISTNALKNSEVKASLSLVNSGIDALNHYLFTNGFISSKKLVFSVQLQDSNKHGSAS